MITIDIDESSGFCWGVVGTVDAVEETLGQNKDKDVYILGQIIHNPKETNRLAKRGLKTITHKDLDSIDKNRSIVIIRAHGEPPSTFKYLNELGLNIIDATCPLVTVLQKKIKKYFDMGYQIVIYGKKEHAEVIGLRGFCNDECIVVRSAEEALETVDLEKKTILFSQTTMDKNGFLEIKKALTEKAKEIIDGIAIDDVFISKNSICKFVSSREKGLTDFASAHDLILFVAGKNSSNAKSLFNKCHSINPNTKFIEDVSEIDPVWFKNAERIGITGATSTPQWYMELVKEEIQNNYR
jgi:4-hydroxy-3-methylbut-2-en-1-yl diphosphate reductase